jgi:CDP-diacylglycerol pyrophosphatase
MKKMFVFPFFFLSFFIHSPVQAADRDLLWNKVHNQCEVGYKTDGEYTPCSLIDEHKDYALLKDDNGPYQYLLLPLKKVTGIEDPFLISDNTPNYLFMAWEARDLVAEKAGNKLSESKISLAVNALNSRSQDQLHVHISCLSTPVRKMLDSVNFSTLDDNWHSLPVKFMGNTINVKTLTYEQFRDGNIFQEVAQKVAEDGKEMKYATLGVVSQKNDFLILQAEGDAAHPVAAEALQDHTCGMGTSSGE